MYGLISSMLGAAILCGAISFHISTNYVEIIMPLSRWFLNRFGFNLVFACLAAFIGIVFLTAGRRGSDVAGLVSRFGNSIAQFYTSAGGSILGWACGICAAAILDGGSRYWLVSMQITIMAMTVSVAPLVGWSISYEATKQFNDRWFRQRWREKPIRVIGLIMLSLSIFYFVYHVQVESQETEVKGSSYKCPLP